MSDYQLAWPHAPIESSGGAINRTTLPDPHHPRIGDVFAVDGEPYLVLCIYEADMHGTVVRICEVRWWEDGSECPFRMAWPVSHIAHDTPIGRVYP